MAQSLANLNVKVAYLDGELCGVDDAGLPSFAKTQAATDGEREVRLVLYAFDLLHLAGFFKPPVDRAQGPRAALGDKQTGTAVQRA